MVPELIERYRLYIGIVLILIIIASGFLLFRGQKKEDSGYKITESSDEAKGTIQVDIEGGVKSPGVYNLPAGSILEDLIVAAGGFSSKVNSNLTAQTINRAEKLKDGDKYYIPIIGDEVSVQAQRGGMTLSGGTAGTYGQNQGIININTADQSALESLPGIGPAKASAIINYRQAHGNFKSIEEIKNVKGIGDKTFEDLKSLITV